MWGWFYPDHVFADSHQLIIQLWIHHLHLLELKDPLVAARRQLVLVFLQTLRHLQGEKKKAAMNSLSFTSALSFRGCWKINFDFPTDLSVSKRHVLTQLVDVLLTGVVQVGLQADVLGLQRFRDLKIYRNFLIPAGEGEEQLKATSEIKTSVR